MQQTMQLMVWLFLIVGLNFKCHTCGHYQAIIWGMAEQSSSAVGIGQFCYRVIII